MRRLWSHIILAATSLLMVGVTFSTVMKKVSNNTNMEFTSGRELVFRINGKNDEDKSIDKERVFNDDKAVNEIAKVMESRLQTSDVTRYKIETQGYDTIKVTFNGESDSEYQMIQDYLTFDATLAISNSKDNVAYAEEFLNPDKKAYLEINNNTYPAIVIPVDGENERFKAVYEEAKKMAEDGEGEVQEEHNEEEEEEGEHEHATHAYLYLWYNYVKEYYSYSKLEEDEEIKSKLLMTFDSQTSYDSDKQVLRAYVSANSDGEASVTADALKAAYAKARYYVNLLNAGELNYYVTYLFSEKANTWIEDPVTLGEVETVAWNRTFIASLCAVVVVSLLLVYFYRLGALSIISTSIVSTFLGLVFIVAFGAEYNVAAIVGLITLAFASITSGIIYLNKFKEECYRGRTLKKANSEAMKRALLPTVDIHVALIAVGVACYLLGGALMKAFAVTSILGGLSSLVLNILGLRGMMWLVTNEQKFANRYDLFDVSQEQIPNTLEEEKQKYYGPNADKDYTKHKKPIGIAATILFVAAIAGMITFGVTKGEVYSTTNRTGNAQLYIEYRTLTDDDMSTTKTKIDTMLKYATIDGTSLNDGTSTNNIVTYEDPHKSSRTETTNSGVEKVTYVYYNLVFDRSFKGNEVIKYTGENEFETDVVDFFTLENLNTTSKCNLGFDANKVTMSFKQNSLRVNADQPNVSSLILATAIGTVIASAYLLLRYRLSRGLATLIITTLSVGITAGIFAFLRFLPVTSYISVALPFVALFALSLGILYLNKEREMVLEDRSRDNSVENRNEIMKKAIAISSTPMTIAFIMALYLGVNFFGFMASSISWIFLAVILGVVVAIALALTIYGPCAQLFFKLFSKVNISRPKVKKKKKARQVRVNKSAEPEEAIFIGIND